MKKNYLLFLLLFVVFGAHSQGLNINGQLIDRTGEPLIGATIVALKSDSSLIKGTTSDVNGNFKLSDLTAGIIILRISYLGFREVVISRELKVTSIDLGKMVMNEQVNALNQVNVVGKIPPVIQKGDTSEINANAFKTNPDADAEDLITKMPGITVQDGKVQAQGEDLQKVLVDGKEFFGDDANAVLKNLPAEVIEKIQIFDKKSDQSELTGFDDGNTSKTINIVTKPQFRNGVFGRAIAGYGLDDKWKTALNLNFFKEQRRFTLLASSNNINEQNFSSDDLLGVMSSTQNRGTGRRGGGRGRSGGSSNDASDFLVDQKNGINTTNSLGLNYVNQWGSLSLTSSYFFNYTDNHATSDLFRQYITGSDAELAYKEFRENNSTNMNHRLNARMEWKIDSFNVLIFQPRISVQQNDGRSLLSGVNTQVDDTLSNTGTSFLSDLKGFNISAPINYRHSFLKRGRTISLNLTPGMNNNEGNNGLYSFTAYYADTLADDSINQVSTIDVNGITLSSNLQYTEPIGKFAQLMFNYGSNYNSGKSDKETFNTSLNDDSYRAFDTTLSGNFNSHYVAHLLGSGYRYQKDKWNVSLGITWQYAQLDGEQVFPDAYKVNKTFTSLLPNARFQYKFTPKRNLRLNYRSNNNAPSVSQLQNVINNSNPLQLTTGNPDLKQDWQNRVTLRYSSSNSEKLTSFMALLSGTFTQDYIVNNTIIASRDTTISEGIVLAQGSQLSRPVNLDGYFSLRSFNNYSIPLKKLKSNLSLNVGVTYTKTPGLVNNKLNYSNSYNTGFGITLSSNISEKIDFTLSSNTSYNKVSNTLQAELNSNYYNQGTRFKLQLMPWRGLVLQSDINHQVNTGLSSSFNQNYLLWNAAIGYKFLPKKEAEFRIIVFDLLKQNNSISRNITETYYEDVRTNVLQQYVMLSFSYNIRYYRQAAGKK